MKKLTILVDMDDCIENLSDVWIDLLNKTHGTAVNRNDISNWDMSIAFPTLKEEDIYAPISSEELWKRVTPLPGAVEYLQRLISEGHKVVIVTSAAAESVPMKLNHVLFRYFPFISMKDVIITSQKQLVCGDVLVDDGVHNLEGGRYEKILMDAPHNRGYRAETNGMTRVRTWEEVYIKICEISNQL